MYVVHFTMHEKNYIIDIRLVFICTAFYIFGEKNIIYVIRVKLFNSNSIMKTQNITSVLNMILFLISKVKIF